MRRPFTGFALALAAFAALFASPASATCLDHRCPPPGWGQVRTVVHYGYYPRYNHVYAFNSVTDPYAYAYEPRGYYPYYNSGYWRPAHDMRVKRRHAYRAQRVPYYQAWGYPVSSYYHRAWHAANHGYIRHDHW
jgi:hypothetical protein